MIKILFHTFFIGLAFIFSTQTSLAETNKETKLTDKAYLKLTDSFANGSDCIKVRRMGKWRDLTRNSLIIYAPSKNKPYYVILEGESLDMHLARTLNARTDSSNFCGKTTDELIIDGYRYKIKAIKALDRKTAQRLVNYQKAQRH